MAGSTMGCLAGRRGIGARSRTSRGLPPTRASRRGPRQRGGDEGPKSFLLVRHDLPAASVEARFRGLRDRRSWRETLAPCRIEPDCPTINRGARQQTHRRKGERLVADIVKNQLGKVLVAAPSPDGRLARLLEYRNVVLQPGGEKQKAFSRWIFADIPHGTLTDDWGNRYNHQVHSLLAGSIQEGLAFLKGLEELGYTIRTADDFFVPLQT